MKKAYTLLGILAIVAVSSLCAFSVSAEVKQSYKSEKVISNVSCETLVTSVEVISVVDLPIEPSTGLKFNEFAILPIVGGFRIYSQYGDSYRIRSQAWIRWQNINSLGKSTTNKNVSFQKGKTIYLLC